MHKLFIEVNSVRVYWNSKRGRYKYARETIQTSVDNANCAESLFECFLILCIALCAPPMVYIIATLSADFSLYVVWCFLCKQMHATCTCFSVFFCLFVGFGDIFSHFMYQTCKRQIDYIIKIQALFCFNFAEIFLFWFLMTMNSRMYRKYLFEPNFCHQ